MSLDQFESFDYLVNLGKLKKNKLFRMMGGNIRK